jgi:hypothetical protein
MAECNELSARELVHEEQCVFECEPRVRHVEPEKLVRLAQQFTAFDAWQCSLGVTQPRLWKHVQEPADRSEHRAFTAQLRRIQNRLEFVWRHAAVPYHTLGLLRRIAVVQGTNTVAGQLGPSRDGPSASFVTDQTPCQIEAAAMQIVSVLCDSHSDALRARPR